MKNLTAIILLLFSSVVMALTPTVGKYDFLSTMNSALTQIGILKNVDIQTTGGLYLPNGTTGQRPTPTKDGMLRYNSSTAAVEVFQSPSWTSLGSGGGTLTGPISATAGVTSITSQTGTGTTFVVDTSPTLVTPNIGAATGTSLSVSGQLTSTQATGTAPLAVTSTTKVTNLYADRSALADTVTTNANLSGDVSSTGNVSTIGASKIFNTMVAASAAIDYAKLASLSTGQVVLGNAGVPTATTLSGGATVGATGTVTLGNTAVTGQALTGFVSGAGTITATDTILTAINKLSAVAGSAGNLTGPITSVGLVTSIASQTGTGTKFVVDTSPTLVTPNIGVATGTSLGLSGQLTSTQATGTAPFAVASTTKVTNLYADRAATADVVTTNANLTGPITSVGNTTSIASQTGTGSKFVVDTSPTLVTPNLGTPSAVVLTSGTGLPISTGVSGLGAGVSAFLGTPSSANLATALTDETGTGLAVFNTSPTLTTPNIGIATASGLFTPIIAGGSATSSNLTLKSTNAVGTTDAIIFQTGNNGSTESMRILDSGNVGIGTPTPNAASLLDVVSTTKAARPAPSMTTTQKLAIASPPAGSQVFDSTIGQLSYYDGTAWQTGLGTLTVDTDWVACTFSTLAWQGLGTITNNTLQCRRQGPNLEMKGNITLGTVTASAANFLLPNNYGTILTESSSAADSYGMILRSTGAAATVFNAISSAGGSVFAASGSLSNATNDPNTPLGGSAAFVTGALLVYQNIKIPIAGWLSNATTFSAASANFGPVNVGATVITATTTAPTKGAIVVDKITATRAGSRLIADYTFQQSSAGSVGSGDYLYTLPVVNSVQLQFDSSVVFHTGTNIQAADATAYVGTGRMNDNATVFYTAQLIAYDATHFRAIPSYGTTAAFASSTNVQFSTNYGLGFHLDVPISGWSQVSQVVGVSKPPTIQKFITGSGTYTTPTGVTNIQVTICGGGGGGGAGSNLGSLTGTTGGTSTFGTSLLTSTGGGGGSSNGAQAGGGGGSNTISAPAISLMDLPGVAGGGSGNSSSTAQAGAPGGNTMLIGGAAATAAANNGNAGITNTGGGGAGGGGTGGGAYPGSGGGGGGCATAQINSPSTTYAYTIGAAGSGASGTTNGGNGAAGIVIVREFY